MKTLGLALAAALMAGAVYAQSGTISVELNKFEATDEGCQAYFLFGNTTGESFEGFEMSLAILDSEGVIDRLLTIDAAPLPAGRTTLKLFGIPGLECGAVGAVLLHDLPSCRPQNGAEMDCFSMLELSSRATAQLVQ
ncbi:MAG: hypothetical protein WD046_10155 [Paracoccaceae bacterium]